MSEFTSRVAPEPNSPRLLAYASLTLCLLFLGKLTNELLVVPIQAQVLSYTSPVLEVQATTVPTASPSATPAPTPSESPETAQNPIEEREAIKRYINTIFGRQGATAYAISLAEGKANKLYQGQVVYNVKAVNKTDYELSVGIFQINLKNKDHYVHYERIPGSTLEEKIEWLKDPYQNTLAAHWIYSTSSWAPWSVFQDGKYLTYLK